MPPASRNHDDAFELVYGFARQFNEPHARLAMHAALPLGLTPELVHLVRVNFVADAPWIAEADLLLSPLCREVGGGYYEMREEAREILIDELDRDEVLGADRIIELSKFLYGWAELNLRRARSADGREYLVTQKWTALAFADPSECEAQLSAALGSELAGQDTDPLRIANVVDALKVPLVAKAPLIAYAAGVRHASEGDAARASRLFARAGALDDEVPIGGTVLPAAGGFVGLGVEEETVVEPRDREGAEDATDTAPKSVYLSYRRDDASLQAQALEDALSRRDVQVVTPPTQLGDVDPGGQWQYSIRNAVDPCGVALVVIGQQWADARSPDGQRLLERDDDTVRFEIGYALETGKTVIPVLVGGAWMPRWDELPHELAPLAERQAVEIEDATLEDGVERLLEALEQWSPEQESPPEAQHQAPRRPPPTDEQLAFSIDRGEQRRTLEAAYKEWRGQAAGAPFLVVVYGEEEELPGAFARGIRDGYLAHFEERPRRSADLTWKPSKSAEQSHAGWLENLAGALGVSELHNISKSGFTGVAHKRLDECFVVTHMHSTDWPEEAPAHLELWLRFWRKLPRFSAPPISVLCIHLDPKRERKGSSKFMEQMGRHRLHDVIRGELRKLDVVPGVVLPEFQPVSLRDIEHWLYKLTPDMFAPEQIEPFREEALSGLKELAAKGDPVPMTRIVAMMQSVAERISPASRS